MRKYEVVLKKTVYGTTRYYEIIEANSMDAATMKMLRTYPRKEIVGIRPISKDGKRGELRLY